MKNRSAVAGRSTPRLGFISETISELKKVVWLTRQEVTYLTTLVLIVVIVVGLILGLIDFGFSRLASTLFIPGN